jgi:hypothetical protein
MTIQLSKNLFYSQNIDAFNNTSEFVTSRVTNKPAVIDRILYGPDPNEGIPESLVVGKTD